MRKEIVGFPKRRIERMKCNSMFEERKKESTFIQEYCDFSTALFTLIVLLHKKAVIEHCCRTEKLFEKFFAILCCLQLHGKNQTILPGRTAAGTVAYTWW